MPSSSPTQPPTILTDTDSSTPSSRDTPNTRSSATSTASSRCCPNGSPDPAFICTLCWRSQPAGTKPKVLGTSARIVCRPCWRTVLNLSICWVCGECIVRGDEVVSLGWCFWHRDCFGCLVCGAGVDLPDSGDSGDDDMRKREWGRWDGSHEERRRGVGVELKSIPMCEVCGSDMAGQSEVLKKESETVSKFDGGLSEDPLAMLCGEGDGEVKVASRHFLRIPRRLRGGRRLERDLKMFINGTSGDSIKELLQNDDQSPLLDNAADTGAIDDGRTDDSHRWTYMGMNGSCGSQPEEIQFDIYDPVTKSPGEPEFIPNNSKPLPTWMQLLPNNVYRERREQNEVAGEQSLSLYENEQSHRVANPAFQGVWGLGFTHSPEPITLMSPTLETKLSQVEIAVKLKTRPTIEMASEITNEQNLGAVGRAQTVKPVYSKNPKSPSSLNQPTRPRTPFPRALLDRDETSSYFSLSKRTVDVTERAQDPCQLGTLSQIPVTYSAEYIEKYQPKTATATYQKYVAKDPEPILDKIKRHRVRGESMGKAAGRIVKRRGSEGNEEYELDPRREDLHKELRNLFYEE